MAAAHARDACSLAEDGCTGGTGGCTSPAAHAVPTTKQNLSCIGLVVLIFYNVSGGPFGSEQAVRAAGPLYSLCGFLLFPAVWSLPQAFLTAELATAFPDDSGYVGWVTAAFGPFWGFVEGVLALVCGATDNAVYPALFVAYLKFGLCDMSLDADMQSTHCPALEDPLFGHLPSMHTFIVFVSAGVLSYLNWRGLELVGNIATGLTVFMLMPFGLMVLLGLPRVDPSQWLVTKPLGHSPGSNGWSGRGRGRQPMGYDWMTYVNVLFWNLNYWDSASTLAGEVENAERNFPRALRWAVLLVVATYILPMGVCIAALPPGQSWNTGFFVQAGQLLGGTWLQAWILAAAAVSCVGQFLSVQAGNTYLLLGMAELGLLPSIFARRSKHGAPALGIILSLATVLLFSASSMVDLVSMLNGVYCLAQLLEFAAFVELRRRCPTLERPYRVPLPFWGCVLMLVCPTLMCLLLLGMPYRNGKSGTALFVASSLPLAVVLYLATEAWRRLRPGSFLREAQQRLGSECAKPGSGEPRQVLEAAEEGKQAASIRPEPNTKKTWKKEMRRAGEDEAIPIREGGALRSRPPQSATTSTDDSASAPAQAQVSPEMLGRPTDQRARELAS